MGFRERPPVVGGRDASRRMKAAPFIRGQQPRSFIIEHTDHDVGDLGKGMAVIIVCSAGSAQRKMLRLDGGRGGGSQRAACGHATP
jgi:hypothetical protein